jgi:hypothetical protein
MKTTSEKWLRINYQTDANREHRRSQPEISPEISIHGLEEELVIARLLLAQNDLEVPQLHLGRRKGNFH